MLRKVGTQVVKWTTEGAVKEDTQNFKTSSILRREGIRQLNGPLRAHGKAECVQNKCRELQKKCKHI